MIHQSKTPGAQIPESQCSAVASYDVNMSTVIQHYTSDNISCIKTTPTDWHRNGSFWENVIALFYIIAPYNLLLILNIYNDSQAVGFWNVTFYIITSLQFESNWLKI